MRLFSFLCVLIALSAAPASASVTVSTTGSQMTVSGDAAADTVRLTESVVGRYPVSDVAIRVDNDAGVVPGPGCVPESSTAASCSEPSGGVAVTLGGGADRITTGFLYVPVTAEGGDGNDTLGPVSGTLDGGQGDDVLLARGYSRTVVAGGAGSDTVRFTEYDAYAVVGAGDQGTGTRVAGDVERLEGSPGTDSFFIGKDAARNLTVIGNGSSDTTSFTLLGDRVRVTLDGAANDGRDGEQNVQTEGVIGGSGDDEITGDGGINALAGGGGNDTLTGGDEGDTLNGGAGNDSVRGGAGNDRLDGGSGADEVLGADGRDSLGGGEGNDRVAGGPGGDTLDGGSGADVLRGEAEGDRVTYAATSQAVTVTLDDKANDGVGGENDDVGGDIEKITGGGGDDTLTGAGGDQEIDGGPGSDRIDGGDGNDKIVGGSGEDSVKGGGGNDDLRGGAGDDALEGGPGEDFVIGQDREDGRDGLDVLELRDGAKDTAACPTGVTRVLADQVDVVAPSCLLVERAPGPGTAAGGAASALTPTPLLRIARRGIGVDRRGVARLRASCPKGPTPCAGVLRLVAVRKRKPVIAATYVFALPSGTTRTVRLRLNKRGRSLLRARRTLRVDVTLAARERGAQQVKVQSLKLRRH